MADSYGTAYLLTLIYGHFHSKGLLVKNNRYEHYGDTPKHGGHRNNP